ncbi:MAG: MerR family transcriptional regulator [Gammaproteobacteria bacterium]
MDITKRLTSTAIARLAGCHVNTVNNYVSRGPLTPLVLSDGTRAFGDDDVGRIRELVAEARRGRLRKAR